MPRPAPPAPYTPRHMAGITYERRLAAVRERTLAVALVACLAGTGIAGTWTFALVLVHTLAWVPAR